MCVCVCVSVCVWVCVCALINPNDLLQEHTFQIWAFD